MVNMNKLLIKIFVMVFFFCVPMFVSADLVESNITPINAGIEEMNLNKITFKSMSYTRFLDLNGSGYPGDEVRGLIVNGYVRDIELDVSLNLYNSKKELIKEIPQTVYVGSKEQVMYRCFVKKNELSGKYNEIKYYSIVTNLKSDVEILDSEDSNPYYIEDYNIKVNVLENNVYEVDTSFVANYKKFVSSVDISIPFRHKYVRDDGTKVNKRAVISDIISNDNISLKTVKANRVVTLGKDDKTSTKKKYSFQYNYNVGKDTLNGNDEFVFYLINNYDVKVDGLSFEIMMPKKISETEVSFIDADGIKVEDVEYDVDFHKIKGKIVGVINPSTSYAIKINLGDNYFTKCSKNISKLSIITLITSFIFLIISLLIAFIAKRYHKKNIYSSLYFNSKINSLEVGYLYNGKVKLSDIGTLLLCLANKGYIGIDTTKKNYKIVKIKDYNENDRVEKIFMEELFKDKKEITRKELNEALGNVEFLMNEKLSSKLDEKIFIKPVFNYRLLFWLMIIIIFILNTRNILIEYQPSYILANTLVCGVGLIILINGMFRRIKPIERIILVVLSLILIMVPVVLTSYPAFIIDTNNLIIYIFSMICIFIIVGISNSMSNRTLYGSMMLHKIVSYKNYLIKADNYIVIDEYVKNKNLYYDVLPYTYVFGISDRWLERFKNEKVKCPKWYKTTKFDLETFDKTIKDIYSDIFVSLKNIEGKNKKS